MGGKKAVKKGSAQSVEYSKAMQAKRELEDNQLRHFTRVWMLDMVTVALGRMGFREARFRKFNDILGQVVEEYDKVFLDDFKDDKEMVYSRECFERELKMYTGKFYAPEEERY